MKRPAPDAGGDLSPVKKRREKDADRATFSEIQFKFLLRDEETISKGLEQFIDAANAYNEGVTTNDVVEAFCKSSPDCADLLVLLDVTQRKLKTSQISQVFECLRHILSRIRIDLDNFTSTGEMIVQRILAAHMAQIYNSLRDQNKSNTVKGTLQLLIAIVMLNDKSKKTVQARFNFDHHVFPTLFARRNRKDSEDIRSCLVLLTMAFVLEGDRQVVSTLVQQKTFLQLTMAGLKHDPREVVTDVLATLLDKVVRGPSISKTLKIKLFSEKVLKQLCGLYKWEGPGGWSRDGAGRRQQENKEERLMEREGFVEQRGMVAATVHEFLCELCCSHKHGILFFDKSFGAGKRNQNQILTHLLEFLSSAVDEPLKRDLMLRVVTACPDQVGHFLPHLDKYLTPRWSDKWKAYMDFVTELYAKLPAAPTFLHSANFHGKDVPTLVSMASTFCLPPPKLSVTLNLAMKHEDLQVRHHCLGLLQGLLARSQAVCTALQANQSAASAVAATREALVTAFLTAVAKALPAPSAVFQCVEKVVEHQEVPRDHGQSKPPLAGLASHLLALLRTLDLLQGLFPAMMSDRPKDVARLIEAVGKLQASADLGTRQQAGSEMEVDADNRRSDDDGDDDDDDDEPEKSSPASPAARTPEDSQSSSLAQFYLLKLLSNTASGQISLGREGLLEKLLRSAHQNVMGKHEDQIVSLVCKMLRGLDVFAAHGRELGIWMSWALKLESSSPALSAPGTPKSSPIGKEKGRASKGGASKDVTHGAKASSSSTSPPFSCVSFLSRCLATLINDPVPYLDRVTEAVVDAGTSLASCQSASALANENAVDAILLTADEELDRLVSRSSLKPGANSDPSNTSPFSPLTIIALDNLQYSKSDDPSIRCYVSSVLLHLLHIQTDPSLLSMAVTKSPSPLCPGVRQYVEGWSLASKTQAPHFPWLVEGVGFPLMAALMAWVETLCGTCPKKKAKEARQAVSSALQPLSLLEKAAALDQALFYLAQATGWTTLPDQERLRLTQFLQEAIRTVFGTIIAEIPTGNEEAGDDAPAKLSSENASGEDFASAQEPDISDISHQHGGQEKMRDVVGSVLGHPVLSDLFLREPELKTGQGSQEDGHSLSESVSKFLCDIFTDCKDLALHSLVPLLMSKYVARALRCLRNRQEVDVCMRSLDAMSHHMDLPALTECFSDILQSPLDLFVAGDISDEENDEPSPLSPAGEVLLKVLIRWLGLIQRRSSETDSFLFPWSRERCFVEAANTSTSEVTQTASERGTRLPLSTTKNFAADLHETFPLEVSKLGPLFDLLARCSDGRLTSEIYRLISLVPHSSSACGDRVFRHLLGGSLSCSESQEVLIRRLVASNTDFYTPCGDFLSKNEKKLMRKGRWWLLAAYLQGARHDPTERKPLWQSLYEQVQRLLEKDMKGKEKEFWDFLGLLVSAHFDSDLAFRFRNWLYEIVYKFVSNNPTSATVSHFDLLSRIISTAGETRNGESSPNSQPQQPDCDRKLPKGTKVPGQTLDPDLAGNFLDLILRHLTFLLSKKANRCSDYEAWLRDLGKAMVSRGNRPSMDFLSTSWSSFVKTALRVSYSDADLLGLLADLVPVVYRSQPAGEAGISPDGGRPSVVPNARSAFQLCISHTAFLPTLLPEPQHPLALPSSSLSSSSSSPSPKAELVRLLHALSLTDSQCLQEVGEVEKMGAVFMAAYTASLSHTDQRLLGMMRGFVLATEAREEVPVLWGKASLEHRSVSHSLGPSLDTEASVKSFLDQIDPVRMARTVLHFPQKRDCGDFAVSDAAELSASRSVCYDPNYLLRVFVQVLSPDKVVPIHAFVAKDCLGFLLVALTSHHPRNRLMAYLALNRFYGHLDGSRCSEKRELAYLLDLLNASRAKDNQRLSFVVALFLARAARLMLYPSHHMYITVLRFLTARPELDLANVPEFYRLFFSSESHFRQERAWILALLRDGIRDSSDYWLYQKKVIFRIIMAFFSSNMGDEASLKLILETVKNACRQKSTCVDLVKEHSLMSWLVMSTRQRGKDPHLTDAFCDLLHTIWFSLSSNVSFNSKSTERRSVTSISRRPSCIGAADRNAVDESSEGAIAATTKVSKGHEDDHGALDQQTSESEAEEMNSKDVSTSQGVKRRQKKKTLVVPKSTIVEVGLAVKSLLWHLNGASAWGVLQLLRVAGSLKEASCGGHPHGAPHMSSRSEPETGEHTPPSTVNPQGRPESACHNERVGDTASPEQDPHRQVSSPLFTLSSAESQVLIYFTAKNVGDKISMARSSAALEKFGVCPEVLHDDLLAQSGRGVGAGMTGRNSSSSCGWEGQQDLEERGEEEEAGDREEDSETKTGDTDIDLDKDMDEDGNSGGKHGAEVATKVDNSHLKSALEAALSPSAKSPVPAPSGTLHS